MPVRRTLALAVVSGLILWEGIERFYPHPNPTPWQGEGIGCQFLSQVVQANHNLRSGVSETRSFRT